MSPDEADRAQVGMWQTVGLLAMVLVAAIAAGVLINTAGLRQAQSSASAANAQATDRLLVIGQTGTAIDDGTVGRVNLTVTAGPATDRIDLRDSTITWVGPASSHSVRSTAAANGGDPAFTVSALTDPDGSAPVLNEPDDRFVLTLDLGDTDDVTGLGEFGAPLRERDMVKLTLVTGGGATTDTRLAVPSSLLDRTAVVL